jgi:hypothetical protein
MDFTLPPDWPAYGPVEDAYDAMTAEEFLALRNPPDK